MGATEDEAALLVRTLLRALTICNRERGEILWPVSNAG
jgi:hypothetical protein